MSEMPLRKKMFKSGDVVEILPEFQDEGDDQFIWVVIGDEEKGRVDITPINMGLPINPLYVVTVDQIKHTDESAEAGN